MKFGIDKISFYTTKYYLNLATLASKKGLDADTFLNRLGQIQMSIPPSCEDCVTMAASAAAQILTEEDKQHITALMFATESGIDQSKAAGIYVHQLLNLPEHCRVVELKQACYGATFGLQMGISMLKANPKQKILVIASDVARYQLNSIAESSQGCGAVAMLLSASPRTLAIDSESAFITKDVMDFWRPNYASEPIVHGTYSCEVYLQLLEKTWQQYNTLNGHKYLDHYGICYHVPVPNLVERAHKRLNKFNNTPNYANDFLADSLKYGREIGNCYTASLYLSLISALENHAVTLTGKRLGFYSYGSGCVAEFFSGIVQQEYKDVLPTIHKELLANRNELSYQDYLAFYQNQSPKDQADFIIPDHQSGKFKLVAIKDFKRIYQ